MGDKELQPSYDMVLMAGGLKGILALMTLLANGIKPFVIAFHDDVELVCNTLDIHHVGSIYNPEARLWLKITKRLLSVHGREIVPNDILNDLHMALNIHPYLSQYKGRDPVERAWKDKELRASVGMHEMTDQLDSGPVILEYFINMPDAKSPEDIKYRLSPHYIKLVNFFVKKYMRPFDSIDEKRMAYQTPEKPTRDKPVDKLIEE